MIAYKESLDRPEDYQVAAINKLMVDFKDSKRLLLMACVASGHTILISMFIREMIYKGYKRFVIVVPEDKIMTRITKMKRHFESGYVGRSIDNDRIAVINYRELKSELKKKPDCIILDEAHIIDEHINDIIKDYIKDDVACLGLTFGTQRTINNSVSSIFYKINAKISLLEMISKERISNIEGQTIYTKYDGSHIAVEGSSYGFEFCKNEVEEMVNTPDRNKIIVNACKRYLKDYKTVIFCCSTKHTKDLTYHLRKADIRAASITQEDDRASIKRYIDAFIRGDITHIVTDDFLLDRFEEPGIEGLLITYPVLSTAKYQKYLGMGIRKSDLNRNKTCKLVEIRDLNIKLSTCPRVFDLPSRLYMKKTNVYEEFGGYKSIFDGNPLTLNMDEDFLTKNSLFRTLCKRDLYSVIKNINLLNIEKKLWFEWDNYNMYSMVQKNVVAHIYKNEVGGYCLKVDNKHINFYKGNLGKIEVIELALKDIKNIIGNLKYYGEKVEVNRDACISDKQKEFLIRLLGKHYEKELVCSMEEASNYIYTIEILSLLCQIKYRINAGKYYGFPLPYVYYFRREYIEKYKDLNPLLDYMVKNRHSIVEWIYEFKPLMWERDIKPYIRKEDLINGLKQESETVEGILINALKNDFEYQALLQRNSRL